MLFYLIILKSKKRKKNFSRLLGLQIWLVLIKIFDAIE